MNQIINIDIAEVSQNIKVCFLSKNKVPTTSRKDCEEIKIDRYH